MKSAQTILNRDGRVEYLEEFLRREDSDVLFKNLMSEIDWSSDELIMFGKHIRMTRKSAWYADESQHYKYAGISRQGKDWTPSLKSIKSKIETAIDTSFNSCLANLYHNGSEGMGMHADNEKMLDPQSPIVSLSLGAERLFRFQHKVGDLMSEVRLQHGSLLIMQPPCQEYWKHALIKAKNIGNARINLTFRNILNG